jgi:hypothetical protein
MATITLNDFFNPLNNTDADIQGLMPNPPGPTTYPLTIYSSGTGTPYDFPNPTNEYQLFYNVGLDEVQIKDNTSGGAVTTVYKYDIGTAQWNAFSDIYDRASVLATYFTTLNTPGVNPPQIFIRPKPYPTSIVYTVNSNAQFTSSINLFVTGPGGAEYSFVPTSNWYQYTVSGLTTGCNYEAIAFQTNNSGISSISTVFRTVQTGYLPGPVNDLSGNIIGTDVKFDWAFSSSNGDAEIQWHVIRDFTQNQKYNVPGFISTFTAPLLIPGLNLFSVEAVNDPGYSLRSYWSTTTV